MMARRAEQLPDNQQGHDAWSETWGDRALQDLGRLLVEYGLGEEQAALIVEQTWLFYSYIALPELQKRFPMGIAAKRSENRPAVYLYLTFDTREGSPGPELGAESFPAVKESFSELFAAPLAGLVEMHLEPFITSQRWFAHHALHNPAELEFKLMAYLAASELDLRYVGIFADDLKAELMTVMDSEVVPLWLETPNMIFGGRKPADLLDDPLDRQLRDVITRAKFNLPAA
jgi:hypothetical protein